MTLPENGSFQIVYNRDEMTTKSFKVENFDVTSGFKKGKATFDVDVLSNSQDKKMYLWERNLRNLSFIINSLPSKSKDVDCYGSHPQLLPVSCEGLITIH